MFVKYNYNRSEADKQLQLYQDLGMYMNCYGFQGGGAKKQYQIIQTNKLSIKQIPIREGGRMMKKRQRK